VKTTTDSRLRNSGIFFCLLVAAAALRFHGLDRLSLWADELWVVIGSAQDTLSAMFDWIYYRDNHPPGYYLLLRYDQQWFGNSDFAIRFPSAVAGTLLVAATWRFGKKHLTPHAGLLAAILVMASYPAIYYSQEARPNIFTALFALLCLHAFCDALFAGEVTLATCAVFWINALLAAYFHYAGLVFCCCLGLCGLLVLALRRDRATLICLFTLFMPAAVLYLPWFTGILHHLVATPVTAWQRPPTLQTLWTTFCFLTGPDDVRIAFYVLALTASLALLTRKQSPHRTILATLLAMIVLPVAVFFIKSLFSQDAYNHRHFLFAIPLMALLAGQALDSGVNLLDERRRRAAGMTLAVVILAVQLLENDIRALYTANHFKQEYREAAQVVANDHTFLTREHTLIVTNVFLFDHYLKRFLSPPRSSDFIYGRDQKIESLDALVDAHRIAEFYYLETPLIPAATQMVPDEDASLMRRYHVACRTRFARAQAWRFTVRDTGSHYDATNAPDCRP